MSTLLEDPKADQITTLVIGPWSEEMFETPPNELVERLVAAADQLPSLTALFFGDVTAEDCEISWIVQTDLSPFFQAFPKLEILRVRGGGSLSLGKIESNHLKKLIIETGGLKAEVIGQIANANLPALEHLEIYSGDSNYGWDGSADDFKPFMSDTLFPNLQYLGLRNCVCADDVAALVADAPVLDKIKVLDLSLGCLGDKGATALLNSDKVLKLENLTCITTIFPMMSPSKFLLCQSRRMWKTDKARQTKTTAIARSVSSQLCLPRKMCVAFFCEIIKHFVLP